LTFGINNNRFSSMIPLNSQQKRFLLVIIVLLLTGLAFRIADRHRRAIGFDIGGFIDGYKYTAEVSASTTEIKPTTNALSPDTVIVKSDKAASSTAKKASGSSKQTTKIKPSEKINVNKADEKELQRLPGIGPVLASRIIAYRDSAGIYSKPADLLNVKGIGQKKLVKIEPYLEF